MSQVEIVADGVFALLPAAYGRAVEPALTCLEHRFSRRDDGSIRAEVHTGRFLEPDGDRLRIPAGSVDRAASVLAAEGHRATIVSAPPPSFAELKAHASSLRDCRQRFPHVARALTNETSALLELSSNAERVHAVGHICKIFPKLRKLIPVLRRAEGRDMVVPLQDYVGGDIAYRSGGTWGSGCRTVVCTYRAWETSNPADWDLVIVPDTTQALHAVGQTCLALYQGIRRFGIIRGFDGLGRRAQLRLELGFGRPYRPASRRRLPPEVTFANAGPRMTPRATSPIQAKREIWSDDRRNAYVASISRGFAERDTGPLWNSGLLLRDINPFARWNVGPSVALVVESEYHLARLGRYLPDWRCEAASGSVRSGRTQGWVDHAIVTLAAAHLRGGLNHDVVINAITNSSRVIPVVPRYRDRSGVAAVVIDSLDDWDEKAVQTTTARIQAYLDAGWLVPDLAPAWLDAVSCARIQPT